VALEDEEELMAITVRELADAALHAQLLERDALLALQGWERLPLHDFVEAVTGRGRFPPAALYRAVAERRGLEYVDCEAADPALEEVRRLPPVLLRRGLVLPVRNGSLEGVTVAAADPDDRQTLATVRRALGREVAVAVAEPLALHGAASRALAAAGHAPAEDGAFAHEDAVALLDAILKEAYLRRASDVHLEPTEGGMSVRIRMDGSLHPLVRGLRPAEGVGLINRVKVLAGLDIAEQRAPQDGGFTYTLPVPGSDPIDIRAATISTRLGERATLRLLGTAARDLTLTTLGMEDDDLARFRAGIRRPFGLLLLCGPTGCGKSTTLYAALREVSRPDLNVMTVEDPIEYKIRGVSQVQVGAAGKITFAGTIRSLLRHDPDVMMVGEIRDGETADVALKAALTGHLVLSTLHTNSAPAALTRLFDLGCEPFLVAGTLVGAISQRLVRRLCPRCRATRQATPAEARFLGSEEDLEVPVATGCARCLGTGFTGRVGLFEMMWVGEEAARRIAARAPEHDLRGAIDLRTLREDGIGKVLRHVTTVEEVMDATLVDA
jgi:type IV pilus assembly protein PilB